MMIGSMRRPWIVFVPPPLLFAAALGLGELAQRGLGFAGPSGSLRAPVFWSGAAICAAGMLLVFACIGRFAAARTTILPAGSPARLVTGGPYRLTRNPMYLGMGCLHLGVAGMRGNACSAALVVVPLALLQLIVIPSEERRLLAAFGEAYAAYCATVPRWL
jgi:protein-S-isoprenylcysteine O-methyltransferase Ste14